MVNEMTPPNPVQKRGMWPPKNGREYKVLDTDDWRNIAVREKIDALDLIRFNFDTNVPAQVNWYLRELVGCRQTRDGHNYVFAGADPSKRKIYLPPLPPRDPQWGDIKSQKILDAIHADLSKGPNFSHADVVDIVRATMDDGVVTLQELTDLGVFAKNATATQMPLRSRKMVQYLVDQVQNVFGAKGQISLNTVLKRYAAGVVVDFLKEESGGAFPRLDRDQIGIDLLLRIANPGIMNQDRTGICGPMALLYSVASDSPVSYAKYVINLYDKGKASLGAIEIAPSKACRSYSPPTTMSPTDWVAAAALRDSDNWWFNVDKDDNGFVMNIASGAALGTIEEWFERSGYTDIKSKSNPLRGLSSGDLTDVNRYYAEGRRVVLRINADLLNAKTQSDWSLKGDHIVVLTSPINLAAPKGGVQFTVFTWGQGTFEIPQGAPLSEKDLLSHLYGYIAAKHL